MRKVEFWLVSTDHLEDRLLFRDVEDFTVGMNIVEFSRYLHKKYGCSEHLRRNGVDIRLIPQENEALERALAYVQMNCVAANICGSPRDYPWGTGACFFTGPVDGLPDVQANAGRPLAGFSARERFRLLHSKADVPGTWVMSDAGYVLPSSYVRKDLVEGVFRSPMRMNYFLRSSSKARLRLEIGEQSLPAFKDQVMAAALPDLCWSLYRKGTVGELSEEQLVELLRQLRFRFSASVSRVARVTGLSYECVAAFLDRV